MFDLGVPELIMILLIALVVFGPGRMPEIGAKLGKAIRDFRNATQSINEEIRSVTNLEPEDEATTRRILAERAEAEQTQVPAAEQAAPAIQETPLPAALAAEAAATANAATTEAAAPDVLGETAPEIEGLDTAPPQMAAVPSGQEPAMVETNAGSSASPDIDEAPPDRDVLAVREEEAASGSEEPRVDHPRGTVTIVRRTIAESRAEEAAAAAPVDTPTTEHST